MKTLPFVLATLCVALAAVRPVCAQQPMEVVASITSQDFSGVVVTKDGRIFVGAPREVDDGAFPTLSEYKDGKLVPWPTDALALPGEPDPAKRLISVHGMTADAKGRLWLIDDGKEAGKPIVPGAPKVAGFDVHTGAVVGWYVLPAGVYLPDSHLNDLRVDLTHGKEGTIFLTDSSFKDHPALIVLDLASGQSRRILADTRFTKADEHLLTYLEGQPRVYGSKGLKMPQGGCDGIELSPDSAKLYWTSLNGRMLWSAPTAVLADANASPAQLEAAVTDEGERPNADGLARDEAGNLYFGAFDQQSIVRRNADGTFALVVHDERLAWPDALFVAADGYLYVTADQWNRMASLNEGRDLRRPPYLILRVKLTPIDEVR